MVNFKCIYPPKTWHSWLCLVLSLFFSQVASAAYTWTLEGKNFPTPSAACTWLGPLNTPPAQSYIYQSTSIVRVSDTRFDCYVHFKWAGPNGGTAKNGPYDIRRSGGSCVSPDVYDPQTGECKQPEPDPCQSTVGQMTTHQHRIGDFSGAGVVNGATDPPGRICSNSCQYAWDGGAPVGVYRFQSGNPNGVFGVFNYKGNGVTCTQSDVAKTNPGSPGATKQQESQCTEKVTDAEGRTHYTCQASQVFKEPGSMSCGTVNGQTTCIPKKPSPKLDDKKVTTEVTEKKASDGSKTTETKTTTTVTTCSGAGACTTTTTTNVNSSKTNADGSSGGDSSTCSGPGCAGNKPDGSEQPKDDEEEQGGSAVSGDMACTALPLCEGDAIQCAILRQTQQQRCSDQEFREVTEKKAADLKSSLASEFSGPDFQPLSAGAEGTFDLSGMVDTSSRFSKSCPVVPDIQFSWIDGSSRSIPLGQAIADLCTILTWLGYFVVAFAMRRGAEIIAGGLS